MKINYKRTTYILAAVLALSLLVNVRVLAGNINSSAAPGATSSYTLEDIYNRLSAGATGSQNAFTEPGSGPGSTMHTLNEIMAAAPVVDATNPAIAADVISGKTFWGLGTGGAWGPKTGSFSVVGSRAVSSSGGISKVLDGNNSDSTPDDSDTETATITQLLIGTSSNTLPEIIGVPSGYRYSTGGNVYNATVSYPVSISSMLSTPTYDPYTGQPLVQVNSYGSSVEFVSGVYRFKESAPIALRLRSLMSKLASLSVPLP